jgi:ABC-type Zn uptake system ZnuABC Zn-binding protein ZnuA
VPRLLLLLTVTALLAACGSSPAATEPSAGVASDPASVAGEPEDGATPTPEATPEPIEEEPTVTVVATVAPVADLVAKVGGDRVEVRSLVPPGTDAHTYEPRPSDVRTLQDADAFVGVGHGLNEAAVRLAEANLPEGAPVVLLGEDALDDDDLLRDAEEHTHTHGGSTHTHSHGDAEHAHERNPHLWTSVRLAMEMVEHLAGVLAELDPEGEAGYAANAEDLIGRLGALDEAISAAVATIPEENRVMVVYHDAWGYFARDHGLEVVAAVQPSDFSEPSAAEVRAIIDQVRAEGVPALFGSEVFPTGVVQAIAEETGATYVGDLSDDVLPGEPGDPEHTYLGLMRGNVTRIVEALGGDPSTL